MTLSRLMAWALVPAATLSLAATRERPVSEPPVPEPPLAACDITFRGSNTGSYTITFEHSMSRVRNKTGWWKKLGSWHGTARAGGSLTSTVRTDFGCSAQRRYRLYFERRSGEDATCYYPSSTSFTDRTSIDLGDVARYFDPARSTSSCRG